MEFLLTIMLDIRQIGCLLGALFTTIIGTNMLT